MLQSGNLRVLCSVCLVWLRARLILMPSRLLLLNAINNKHQKEKIMCNRFGNRAEKKSKTRKKKSQPAKCQTHSFSFLLVPAH